MYLYFVTCITNYVMMMTYKFIVIMQDGWEGSGDGWYVQSAGCRVQDLVNYFCMMAMLVGSVTCGSCCCSHVAHAVAHTWLMLLLTRGSCSCSCSHVAHAGVHTWLINVLNHPAYSWLT